MTGHRKLGSQLVQLFRVKAGELARLESRAAWRS